MCLVDMVVCIVYNINEVIGIDLEYFNIFVCKFIGGLIWIIFFVLFCLICCVLLECYLVVVKLFDFIFNICCIVFMIIFLWYYFFMFILLDFYFFKRLEVLFCGWGLVLFCLYDFFWGIDIMVILLMIFLVMFLVLLVFIVFINFVVIYVLLCG